MHESGTGDDNQNRHENVIVSAFRRRRKLFNFPFIRFSFGIFKSNEHYFNFDSTNKRKLQNRISKSQTFVP